MRSERQRWRGVRGMPACRGGPPPHATCDATRPGGYRRRRPQPPAPVGRTAHRSLPPEPRRAATPIATAALRWARLGRCGYPGRLAQTASSDPLVVRRTPIVTLRPNYSVTPKEIGPDRFDAQEARPPGRRSSRYAEDCDTGRTRRLFTGTATLACAAICSVREGDVEGAAAGRPLPNLLIQPKWPTRGDRALLTRSRVP